MLEKYNSIREQVRTTIYKEPVNPSECVRLSKEYLFKLKNEDTNEDLSYDLLIANYYLALGYKKLNQFELALKHAMTALRYTTPFQIDYNHIMTKWLIAETKFELGDKDYAIKTYRDCQSMFEKLNQMRYVACMRFNIYKIQMNEIEMLSLTKEYQDFVMNENKSNYTYLDEAQKDSLLQDMYLELAGIYIIKGKNQEAFNLLKNIKNKDLRTKVYDKLVA